MAAPLNPNQLRMFMTAREMVGELAPGDVEGHGTPERMWKDKRADNKIEGIDLHIKANGVHVPVDVMHRDGGAAPMLWDGHHRTISAYDSDPESLVPVMHHDSSTWANPTSRAFSRDTPGWEY